MSTAKRRADAVDRNRRQVRKMVRMFETGDLQAVEGVIAPDYLDHQADEETGQGPTAFGQAVQGARRFSAPAITVADLVADADLGAVRLVWEWQHPAGRRETIDLIRFVSGLATEHWGAPLE